MAHLGRGTNIVNFDILEQEGFGIPSSVDSMFPAYLQVIAKQLRGPKLYIEAVTDDYLICYIQGGEVEFEQGDTKQIAQKGDFIFRTSNEPFAFRAAGGKTVSMLMLWCIPESTLPLVQRYLNRSYGVFSPVLESYPSQLIHHMWEHSKREDQLGEEICNQLVPSLIQEVALALKGVRQNDYKYERFLGCKGYIDEHYIDLDSIQEACDKCHLSRTHLWRLFMEYEKVNPNDYLNRLRMKHAAKLLWETTLSVSEIAAELSFEDLPTFSRAFKRFSGQSPKNYRKICFAGNG